MTNEDKKVFYIVEVEDNNNTLILTGRVLELVSIGEYLTTSMDKTIQVQIKKLLFYEVEVEKVDAGMSAKVFLNKLPEIRFEAGEYLYKVNEDK